MSAVGIGKLGLGAAGATAVVALIAGCASSAHATKTAAGGAAASSGLNSRSTSIGTVLVSSSGRTVYELVGDSASHHTCNAACLAIWPAVQKNGKQVVVNGHPAFTYIEDKSPGDTKGQNLKDQWGLWLALDASGNPITAGSAHSSPAKSKAPSGGGPAF
jgi:predicted lipoprotein with Yx(FWY)xxD motif